MEKINSPYVLGEFSYRNSSCIIWNKQYRLLEFDAPEIKRLTFFIDHQGAIDDRYIIDPTNILTSERGWARLEIEIKASSELHPRKYNFRSHLQLVKSYKDLLNAKSQNSSQPPPIIFNDVHLIRPGKIVQLQTSISHLYYCIGVCSAPHKLIKY